MGCQIIVGGSYNGINQETEGHIAISGLKFFFEDKLPYPLTGEIRVYGWG
jgi:hypothetical protein